MKCKEIKKLLYCELDSPLTDKQSKIIKEHIKLCTACAKEKKEIIIYQKKISENFSNIDIPELTPEFDRSFYRRLRQQKTITEKMIDFKDFILPVIPKRVFAPVFVMAVILLMIVLIPERVKITQIVETNTSSLIKHALYEAENTHLENIVSSQVKELLQNFL